MKHKKPSELEIDLKNLSKEPLTEREVMASFFLCLGGIVVGLVFLFWASQGISTVDPHNVDAARIAITCSGGALMTVGTLSLTMMGREVRGYAKR